MKTTENIVTEYLKLKGITKRKLAELLGTSPQNLGAKLKTNTLDVHFIRQCSVALKHNFFQDMASEFESKEDTLTVANEDPAIYGPIERIVERIVEQKLREKERNKK
jgi:transcriptional regulator with XRE-family HTH domain